MRSPFCRILVKPERLPTNNALLLPGEPVSTPALRQYSRREFNDICEDKCVKLRSLNLTAFGNPGARSPSRARISSSPGVPAQTAVSFSGLVPPPCMVPFNITSLSPLARKPRPGGMALKVAPGTPGTGLLVIATSSSAPGIPSQ